MRALETCACLVCAVLCMIFVPLYYSYREKQESTEQADARILEELAYEVERSGRLSMEMLYYADVTAYAYDRDMVMVSWQEIGDELEKNGFYDFKDRQDRYVVMKLHNCKKYIRLT